MPVSKTELGKRYGVSFTNMSRAKETLDTYASLIAKVKEADESRKKDVKRDEIKSELAQDLDAAKRASDIGDQLASVLFTERDSDGFYVHALEVMNEITSHLRVYVDAAVDQKMAGKRAATAPKKIEAMRRDASVFKDALRTQLQFILDNKDELRNDGVEVDFVPTRVSDKTAKTLIVLDEVPGTKGRKPGENGHGGISNSTHVYAVDGESLPEGTLLASVATQWLSTPERTVTRQDIHNLVKAQDINPYTKDWTVEINGHSVTATRIGTDEEDSE